MITLVKKIFNEYCSFLIKNGLVFYDSNGSKVNPKDIWENADIEHILNDYKIPPKTTQKFFELSIINRIFFEGQWIKSQRIYPVGNKDIQKATLDFLRISAKDLNDFG